MALSNTCNLLLKKALPKGAAWIPIPQGEYDLTLEAMSDIICLIANRLQESRYTRNAQLTNILTDLEREYGVLANKLLSEQERRDFLEGKINKSPGAGTADDLQDALDAAGFDLQVHKNDPAVDPAIFLLQNFQMVAGGDNAYAGRPDAYAGLLGGELLVNTFIFDQFNAYEMQAGGSVAYAGRDEAVAGYFNSLSRIPIEYTIPTSSDNWPFVFFVGGDATRDPVTNELTNIEQGMVQSTREEELKRIIMSIKPLFTWCGLIITYT